MSEITRLLQTIEGIPFVLKELEDMTFTEEQLASAYTPQAVEAYDILINRINEGGEAAKKAFAEIKGFKSVLVEAAITLRRAQRIQEEQLSLNNPQQDNVLTNYPQSS